MTPKRLRQTIRKIKMFDREGRYKDIVNARNSFIGEMKHLAWTPLTYKVMETFDELLAD